MSWKRAASILALILARWGAFLGALFATRAVQYCRLLLVARFLSASIYAAPASTQPSLNSSCWEMPETLVRFVVPEASRRSEDYVHARATASGTFPLSARVSSACGRGHFCALSLLIYITLSIRESSPAAATPANDCTAERAPASHLEQHAPSQPQGIKPLFVRIPGFVVVPRPVSNPVLQILT